MARYALVRLLQMVPLLLMVSLLSFGLIKLVPGDPAVVMGGATATAAEIEAIRHNLGLDRPLHEQLWDYYRNLARGDLGRSLMLGQPVSDALLERAPVTFAVAAYSMVLTLVLGLITGIAAALRHNRWLDQFVSFVALLGVSLPNFWLGLMMIVVFSVYLGWLPTGGYIGPLESPAGFLRTATLPAVSLALLQIGLLTRMTRSAMLEELRQDYVRTARAKGASAQAVNYDHALRNALLPVVTIVGIEAAFLIGGLIVTETVFNIPGVARFLVEAIRTRDYPIVQNLVMFIAIVVVVVNFCVDLAYAALDPRIKYAE